MNFLHTFSPNPIFLQIGPLIIHWYGIFIVLGIITGSTVAIHLGKKYNISQNKIVDSAFYSIIFGIIGARIYHIFLELPYYIEHPLNVFKIWQGGIAIHGGLILGGITLYLFCKKRKINFLKLVSIYVPSLALAQSIGRFGNYFNQELYGLPTNLPWGIPINLENRIVDFVDFTFFHPTFLYESIGNFAIFIILLYIHKTVLVKKEQNKFKKNLYLLCILTYAILYSLLRFSLEFIRIDNTPELFGLRFPQVISLIIIGLSLIFLIKILSENKEKDAT